MHMLMISASDMISYFFKSHVAMGCDSFFTLSESLCGGLGNHVALVQVLRWIWLRRCDLKACHGGLPHQFVYPLASRVQDLNAAGGQVRNRCLLLGCAAEAGGADFRYHFHISNIVIVIK